MNALEPTNEQRAEWAGNALALFTAETYGDHPDTMHASDVESAIGDLICDLLHLAAREGIVVGVIHAHALEMFETELAEEERCNCANRSWYGPHHDTQCPVRLKVDAPSAQAGTSDAAKPVPYWLDALLDIKRMAEKSGDHEADPWALLDLIADKARASINQAIKE